jgi:hypothetical protein
MKEPDIHTEMRRYSLTRLAALVAMAKLLLVPKRPLRLVASEGKVLP